MIEASEDELFIGVIVNPKTHEPVIVEKKRDKDRTVIIRALGQREAPIGFYSYKTAGEGYLAYEHDDQQYLLPVRETGYPRVHTPEGVEPAFKGRGFGTCLYAAVCLIATARAMQLLSVPRAAGGMKTGVCSASKSRSDDADEWWDAAVERGLATRQRMESQESEETEYDEDLFSYMSSYGRNAVKNAIHDAFMDSEWAPSDIKVTGDVTRSTYDEDSEDDVDILTYGALQKFKLVAVLQPFNGNFTAWSRSDRRSTEHANKDVILALNVARQDLRFVGKLALIAQDLGATEREITGMMMRQKYGFDEMTGAWKPPTFSSNPRKRKRGGPRHGEGGPLDRRVESPPIDLPRQNPDPEPTQRELAQLARLSDDLRERRQRLGWTALEDLP